MRDRHERVERKLREQWRMTCPEHHHDLEDKAGPSVYCKQCGHAYRYEELIDKREQADPRPTDRR